MNIILCEGITDAIILSYYLIKVHGFNHYKGKPPLKLTVETENEKCYWYQKEGKHPNTIIWAVGGISKFKPALNKIIIRNMDEPNNDKLLNHIVIVLDRDHHNDTECIQMVHGWISHANIMIDHGGHLKNKTWCPGTMQKFPEDQIPLKILPIFLPTDDTPGSLEDFLLTTLESQPDERIVVAEARKFIATIPDEPFLPRTRLRNKACLGATLAVFSPDWVLTKLDAKLRSVPWQEMKAFQEAFSEIMLP